MAYTVGQLLTMNQADLDALFTATQPGPIPTGESRGTAIGQEGVFRDRCTLQVNASPSTRAVGLQTRSFGLSNTSALTAI